MKHYMNPALEPLVSSMTAQIEIERDIEKRIAQIEEARRKIDSKSFVSWEDWQNLERSGVRGDNAAAACLGFYLEGERWYLKIEDTEGITLREFIEKEAGKKLKLIAVGTKRPNPANWNPRDEVHLYLAESVEDALKIHQELGSGGQEDLAVEVDMSKRGLVLGMPEFYRD